MRFAAYSSSVICPFTRSCSSSESRADDGARTFGCEGAATRLLATMATTISAVTTAAMTSSTAKMTRMCHAGESVTHIRSLPAPTTPPTAASDGSSLAEVPPVSARVSADSNLQSTPAANGAGLGRYIDWVMVCTAKPQYAIHDVVVRIVFARISFHAPTRCRMACRSDPTTNRE